MGATAASLTADFVSKYCFGLRPVLDFGAIGQLPLGEYGWLIPLGLVAGLVGSLMNRSLLGFQRCTASFPHGAPFDRDRTRAANRHLAA